MRHILHILIRTFPQSSATTSNRPICRAPSQSIKSMPHHMTQQRAAHIIPQNSISQPREIFASIPQTATQTLTFNKTRGISNITTLHKTPRRSQQRKLKTHKQTCEHQLQEHKKAQPSFLQPPNMIKRNLRPLHSRRIRSTGLVEVRNNPVLNIAVVIVPSPLTPRASAPR